MPQSEVPTICPFFLLGLHYLEHRTLTKLEPHRILRALRIGGRVCARRAWTNWAIRCHSSSPSRSSGTLDCYPLFTLRTFVEFFASILCTNSLRYQSQPCRRRSKALPFPRPFACSGSLALICPCRCGNVVFKASTARFKGSFQRHLCFGAQEAELMGSPAKFFFGAGALGEASGVGLAKSPSKNLSPQGLLGNCLWPLFSNPLPN